MADVTITGLNNLTPSNNTYVPISNGTTTGKAIYNPVPVGGIIMWSGSVASIPTGWALCNGQNGTPNLQDRFIVGAGSAYNPNDVGGVNTVTPTGTVGNTTLTIDQIPSHSHVIAGFYQNNVAARASAQIGIFSQNQAELAENRNTNSTGSGNAHTHTFTGVSQTNMPPYYALAYIMRTI